MWYGHAVKRGCEFNLKQKNENVREAKERKTRKRWKCCIERDIRMRNFTGERKLIIDLDGGGFVGIALSYERERSRGKRGQRRRNMKRK